LNNLTVKKCILPVYHENNPHLDNRYVFSVISACLCLEVSYPAMAAAGTALSVEPLALGGSKFFGRGGSRCRYCWIKYFHKHAEITEKVFVI